MNTHTPKFENPLQQWMLEEISPAYNNIPLCYFKLSLTESGKNAPPTEKCDFYNDQNYYCSPFMKLYSQFSAII